MYLFTVNTQTTLLLINGRHRERMTDLVDPAKHAYIVYHNQKVIAVHIEIQSLN